MNQKDNHYHCKKCNVSWIEPFEEEYGHCESECPKCETSYTPFDTIKEWQDASKYIPKLTDDSLKELCRILMRTTNIESQYSNLLTLANVEATHRGFRDWMEYRFKCMKDE